MSTFAVRHLSRTQLHLHMPAAGVARHGELKVRREVRTAQVSEASALHALLTLLLLHRGFQLVKLVAGVDHLPPVLLVRAQDREAVILHANLLRSSVSCSAKTLFNSLLLREALKLLVCDGTHQRRLTALVRSQQTVEPVALEVYLRIARNSVNVP